MLYLNMLIINHLNTNPSQQKPSTKCKVCRYHMQTALAVLNAFLNLHANRQLYINNNRLQTIYTGQPVLDVRTEGFHRSKVSLPACPS